MFLFNLIKTFNFCILIYIIILNIITFSSNLVLFNLIKILTFCILILIILIILTLCILIIRGIFKMIRFSYTWWLKIFIYLINCFCILFLFNLIINLFIIFNKLFFVIIYLFTLNIYARLLFCRKRSYLKLIMILILFGLIFINLWK